MNLVGTSTRPTEKNTLWVGGRGLSPRRGFSKGAKETLGSQEAGCSRDTAYIYITISMSVDALDGLPALTFGSKEIFWEVAGHHKRTSATFYERAPPVNIPPRSISAVRNTNWTKIAILEFTDLAVLEA